MADGEEYRLSKPAAEIDAILGGALRFDAPQELTEQEKNQAIDNMGLDANKLKFGINGYFDTYADLEATITEPKGGESYGVGLEAPYDVYTWDALRNRWINNGPIHGVNGKDGADGAPGKDAEVTLESITTALGYTPGTVVPNLLHNSNFANPVNQRRQTTYNAKGYGIDRWYAYSDALSAEIVSGGITLSNASNETTGIIQRFDVDVSAEMEGKTLTFVVCESDGTILLTSGRVAEGAVSETTAQFVAVDPENRYYINYYKKANAISEVRININSGNSVTFAWAALYEGEYTKESLPKYAIPNYGLELAICQRYYLHTIERGTGYATSSRLYCMVPIPRRMRANPSILNLNLATMRANATSTPVTSVSLSNMTDNGVNLNIDYASTSGVANHAGVWTGSCSLSAEV